MCNSNSKTCHSARWAVVLLAAATVCTLAWFKTIPRSLLSLPPPPPADGRESKPCFRNGHLFFHGHSGWSQTAADCAGLHHLAVGSRDWIPAEQDGTNVTMLSVDLYLAWFTAPRNVYHMLRQTVLPLAESLLTHQFHGGFPTGAPVHDAPFVVIGHTLAQGWEQMPGWGDDKYWLPHHHSPQRLQSSLQFQQLLSVLPIQATLLAYSGDHETASFRHTLMPIELGRDNQTISAPSAYTKTVLGIERDRTYCFREMHVVKGDAAPPIADVMSNIWLRMADCPSKRTTMLTAALETAVTVPTNPNSTVVCMIIQRNESRRILNIKQVATVAGKHCGRVRIVDLARLSLSEQVALFLCPDRLVIMGAHGAGLAWNTKLCGQDPGHPQVGGVIEWGLGKWGQEGFYKNKEFLYRYHVNPNVTCPHNEEINARGCHIRDDPNCIYPDKFCDFDVDMPAFESDLSAIMSALPASR